MSLFHQRVGQIDAHDARGHFGDCRIYDFPLRRGRESRPLRLGKHRRLPIITCLAEIGAHGEYRELPHITFPCSVGEILAHRVEGQIADCRLLHSLAVWAKLASTAWGAHIRSCCATSFLLSWARISPTACGNTSAFEEHYFAFLHGRYWRPSNNQIKFIFKQYSFDTHIYITPSTLLSAANGLQVKIGWRIPIKVFVVIPLRA